MRMLKPSIKSSIASKLLPLKWIHAQLEDRVADILPKTGKGPTALILLVFEAIEAVVLNAGKPGQTNTFG